MEYTDYTESVIYEIARQAELEYNEACTMIERLDMSHYEKVYFPSELAELLVLEWKSNTEEILKAVKA